MEELDQADEENGPDTRTAPHYGGHGEHDSRIGALEPEEKPPETTEVTGG
ncbi:MAG: hypothetical protein Kow00122_12700 [Thermoleophilia bacterium]